jgi:fermentation-respiration switch protein FrsA (DUF1100 family)
MDEGRKRFWRRILWGGLSPSRLLKSVAFIYGALCLFAVLASDRLLFRPHPSSYAGDPAILRLPTSGGTTIAARYLPSSVDAPYTILYSHGNSEDLGDLAPRIGRLQGLGFAVLAYDYEGYGESGGTPSEEGVIRDVDAAYAYLTERRGVPPGKIIAYGRSLGGGPSVDLASRRPIGGLILESTFTSVFRVVTRVPLFPGDKLRNLEKMERVACPVLVMHGRADTLISIRHGEALLAAARGPKRSLWVDGVGHGDLPFAAGGVYDAAIADFVRLLR